MWHARSVLDADLIGAALILTLGVTLQTAVGFGLGLLCIPMLVWSGWALPQAVAILIGAGFVQTGLGTFTVRREIRWSFMLPLALALCVGIPIGQYAMGLIVDAGQAIVKQAVGGMLLAVLVARAIYQPAPRDAVARGWGYFACGLGGVLGGLVGMGGPPLVLFALAHTWNKDQYRAFIWPIFFLTTPVLVAGLALRFDTGVLIEFAKGVAMAPCVWLGSRAGMAISQQWEMKQLQLGASILLYGIAISSIVGPLL